MEDVPGDHSSMTAEELSAMTNFTDNYFRDDSGRYGVMLPRRSPLPELGESRLTALKRFHQNERSLKHKGQWERFYLALEEYSQLHHSERVPASELSKPPSKVYYLPMHCVLKESSSTTKLRIVFDASANTSSGISFNQQLLPGPSIYPLLTSVINRFL